MNWGPESAEFAHAQSNTRLWHDNVIRFSRLSFCPTTPPISALGLEFQPFWPQEYPIPPQNNSWLHLCRLLHRRWDASTLSIL